jgi:hypothetical protein
MADSQDVHIAPQDVYGLWQLTELSGGAALME